MTMQNEFFGPNFIRDLFEEDRRLPFFGGLQNQNLSPIQRQFFQTQFQPFENRFLGQSANLLQGGTGIGDLPTFQDFLSGINFNQEFNTLPPSLRPGGNRSNFAPQTRRLF